MIRRGDTKENCEVCFLLFLSLFLTSLQQGQTSLSSPPPSFLEIKQDLRIVSRGGRKEGGGNKGTIKVPPRRREEGKDVYTFVLSEPLFSLLSLNVAVMES